MEMQALSNGVLRKILINEGESAPLGQLIAVIGEPNEDISALLSEAPPAKTESPKPAPPEAAQTPVAAPEANGHAKPQAVQTESGRMSIVGGVSANTGLMCVSIKIPGRFLKGT